MNNDKLDRRARYSIRAMQNSLLELLEEKSLDAVSITELCARADINRGTFYKYYRDVYELYEEIEDGFVEDLRKLFAEACDQEENFFLKVTSILQNNRNFVQPNHQTEGASRLLSKLLGLVLPKIYEMVSVQRPDLQPEAARYRSEFILGGCARVYEVWIKEGMIIPVDQMQVYMNDFVTSMIYAHYNEANCYKRQ